MYVQMGLLDRADQFLKKRGCSIRPGEDEQTPIEPCGRASQGSKLLKEPLESMKKGFIGIHRDVICASLLRLFTLI